MYLCSFDSCSTQTDAVSLENKCMVQLGYVSCYMARSGLSRSSKVINFGTNWKPECDFLLVFSNNLGPVYNRFGNIAS